MGDRQRQRRLLCAPDGATLATVGRQVIRFWEVASGHEIQPQSGGQHSAIGAAVFTPDGRSIVTVGHDRTIRFWDLAAGKEIRQLERCEASLQFVAFSADGKTMSTGYGDQPTRLWDVASGRDCAGFSCLARLTISLSLARTYRPMARRWPRRRTTGCYSGTQPLVT